MKSDVKNIRKHSKQRKVFRNLLVFLIFIAACGALVMNANWGQLKRRLTQENEVSVSTEIIEEPEVILEEAIPSAQKANSLENSILSFAPEEQEEEGEEITENMIEAFNPYAQIVRQDEELENAKKLKKLESAFGEYRAYLKNANKLLAKFAADENYDKELEILKKQPCSAKSQEIVLLLEFYNKQLVDQGSEDHEETEVKLLDSDLLDKIVKIKRVKINSNQQRELKEKIQSKLPILTEYIFSTELQQSFMDR